MHTCLEQLIFVKNKVNEIVNKKQLKINPKIIVVTKTFSLNKIIPLLENGHIHYGENKIQEAEDKWTEIKDQFKTNNMIFGISDYLVKITKYITLFPGDVVWMGTDEVPSNIKNGDVVDIEISGIGTLSNPVLKKIS